MCVESRVHTNTHTHGHTRTHRRVECSIFRDLLVIGHGVEVKLLACPCAGLLELQGVAQGPIIQLIIQGGRIILNSIICTVLRFLFILIFLFVASLVATEAPATFW